jgi:membrane protease YdiL (CAAX protease family)
MDKLKNITLGLVAALLYVMFANQVLGWAGLYGHPWRITPTVPELGHLFWACILAPVWEELAFRYAPLELSKKFEGTLLPVVAISSILFGYQHGGVGGIMIQGVLGAIFCWVYVKNGYSLLSSMTLHSLWNLFCAFFL